MSTIISGQFSGLPSGAIALDPTFGRTQDGIIDDDAPLVRRAREGDKLAYSRLVERHERRVMTLISQVVCSSGASRAQFHCDVEDLAQEVFVQAWKSLPSFRGQARFCTWLYRIAINRALKERRRIKAQPISSWLFSGVLFDEQSVVNHDREPASTDPADSVCESAQAQALRESIDALSDKHRLVILLHYYDGYSCDEIAAIIDCSVGTIWSRLHYACQKLRTTLSSPDD